MYYLTVTLRGKYRCPHFIHEETGLEIELKYFVQGLPVRRSNPPGMRQEESMRYTQIFPYTEAFFCLKLHTYVGICDPGIAW